MPIPLLFEAFPSLEHQIPWTSLVETPTPVNRLDQIENTIQSSHSLWVKQDNLTSPRFGGNKIRKLEFLIGDALQQGKTSIATIGGLGTNHGLATTIYGRDAGLSVRLYLFDQPINSFVLRNLKLMHYYGAQIVYGKTYSKILRRFNYLDRLRYRNTYWLPAGGSTPIGLLGYVNAVFELKEQINQGALPEPRFIFVPVGTMGTLAGIELGLQLAGLHSTVIGVRVIDAAIANHSGTVKLIQQAITYLRQYLRLDLHYAPRFTLVHDFFGTHYGAYTPEAQQAIDLAATHGNLTLDPTYSGKAFAAFLHHATTTNDTSPLLFWNTFNSADLNSIAEQVDYHSLPHPFHQFFTSQHT